MKTLAVSALLMGAMIGLANADGNVSNTPELTLAMSASDAISWPKAEVDADPNGKASEVEMQVMKKLTLERVSLKLTDQLERQFEQKLRRTAE